MTQKTGKSSDVETKLIRELAKILNDTDLSEIEMEKGDLRLRVARGSGPMTVAHAAPAAIPAAAAPVVEAAPVETAPADNPNAVKSPMVGTAYIRPSPDKDTFVNVGDSVKEGDTILLVEAMKTFNPIKAPRSGTVTDVLVQDAQPVEFGEALIIIG
jgi:acetyl-CoA carboxylase biotin carboxyl carrier protein